MLRQETPESPAPEPEPTPDDDEGGDEE